MVQVPDKLLYIIAGCFIALVTFMTVANYKSPEVIITTLPSSTSTDSSPPEKSSSSFTSNMNDNNNNDLIEELYDVVGRIFDTHQKLNNRGLDKEYRPQIRYEPTSFHRGERPPAGRTPLTMIRDKLVPPQAQLPIDWDGGFGWVFVKYHPSPLESQWKEASKPVEKNLKGTPLCDLQRNRFKRQFDIYIQQLNRMPAENGGNEQCQGGKLPDEPMKFDDEVFSKFEYEFKCTRPPCRSPPPLSPKIGEKKFSYIEPLAGILRHPQVCENAPHFFVNKNYMVVDPWPLVHASRSTISPEPKVLYLDGGASVWDQGAGGASQSWFHKIYEGKCLNFTDWYMYEAQNHDPKHVFKLLPGHIKPGYRWYNIFLQTEANHWDNPNNVLLTEARKEDVVIFKIDFDSPQIEAALIEQILAFPQVSELIDELFFEHHINMEILRGAWRIPHSYQVWHSDSLRLFSGLRKRGIRAHSWV